MDDFHLAHRLDRPSLMSYKGGGKGGRRRAQTRRSLLLLLLLLLVLLLLLLLLTHVGGGVDTDRRTSQSDPSFLGGGSCRVRPPSHRDPRAKCRDDAKKTPHFFGFACPIIFFSFLQGLRFPDTVAVQTFGPWPGVCASAVARGPDRWAASKRTEASE